MTTPTTYEGLVIEIIDIITVLIIGLGAVVFIYFVWKMISLWVLGAGDQQKREAGRQYAIAAVIVFVLALSTWGIVSLIRRSLIGF